MQTVSALEYYEKFHCIGSDCQDTCCAGWSVPVDRLTYQRYLSSEDPVLKPIIQLALHREATVDAGDDSRFGVMRMRSDKTCHFLQEDKLCAIQRRLGEEALSDTCRIFPRYFNQFGEQREYALGISCPEAARLILLPSAPLKFIALEVASPSKPFTNRRFPRQGTGDPKQIEVLNDFRALIIAVLQCREMGMGARMMLLGWLLEDASVIVESESFGHASELVPVLQSVAAMLARPEDLEKQFAQIPKDTARKLQAMAHFIGQTLLTNISPRYRECLMAASEGLLGGASVADSADAGEELLAHFQDNYTRYFQPFMRENAHIFEHYLVNMVITQLFPFVGGDYLSLYRKLVFNLAILQLLLVGIAAKHKGLSEAWVIQLFQSFSRKSDHNLKHLDTLLDALQVGEKDSFAQIMWMLQEVTPVL